MSAPFSAFSAARCARKAASRGGDSPSSTRRRAVARSSAACTGRGRAATERSRGAFVHDFALAGGPVGHRSDDVLAALVLGEIGHEDIDRRPCADGTADRADQPRSVRRVDPVEDHEQVEVAVWTSSPRATRTEEHDPSRRRRPDHVLDGNRQPRPQCPALPQRPLLHGLRVGPRPGHQRQRRRLRADRRGPVRGVLKRLRGQGALPGEGGAGGRTRTDDLPLTRRKSIR